MEELQELLFELGMRKKLKSEGVKSIMGIDEI